MSIIRAERKKVSVLLLAILMLCVTEFVLCGISVRADENEVLFLPKGSIYKIENEQNYKIEVTDPLGNPQIPLANFKLNLRGEYRFVFKNGEGKIVREVKVVSYADTDSVEWNAGSLLSCLGYGQTVTVNPPEASFYGYVRSGTLKITSPSGVTTIIDRATEYTVGEKGNYSLEYSVSFGEKTLKEQKTLAASVNAGSLIRADKDILSITPGRALPSYSSAGRGVEVRFLPGGQFGYKHKIDLNLLGQDDNIVSLQVLSGQNVGAISNMTVTLTDAHDPDNQVYFYFRATDIGDHAYVLFSYDGRELGRSNESNDYGQVREYWGSVAWNRSFFGSKFSNRQPFSVSADYSQGQFFIDAGGKWMILDADDPDQVGAGKEWKGFKTGEVYLSLKFGFENALPGGVIVTEIAGKSVGEESFSESEYSTPDVTVLIDAEYLKKMPLGAVGLKYPVPSARSLDFLTGDCKVDCKIKKKGSDEVLAENAEFFLPEESGDYLVVYTAESSLGRKNERVLEFRVNDELPPTLITFANKPSAPKAMTTFRIPKFVFSGGSGRIEGSEIVRLNGREVAIDESRQLFIGEAGVLTVTAIARGYCGEPVHRTFVFEIATDPELVVSGLPLFFKTGETIGIPEFLVIDPANIGKVYELRFYVDGVLTTDEWVVPETDSEEVSLRFEGCYENRVIAEYEVVVPTVKASEIHDVFRVVEGSAIKTSNLYGTEITTATDGTRLELPNGVGAENLALRFYIDSGRSAFDFLEFTFEDLYNENISTFVRIFPRDDSTSWIQTSDGARFVTEGSFKTGNVMFSLIFHFRDGKICDSLDREICKVSTLPGLAAHIFVKFGGVSGESCVTINQVSNHFFNRNSNLTGDRRAPVIVLDEVIPSRQNVTKNSVITVPSGKAYDVVSYRSFLNIEITSPSGAILFSGDAKQKTSFEVSEYGAYNVKYTATDGNGNSTAMDYYFVVADVTKPTVTIDHNMRLTYKLGDKLLVPTATAVDDIDGECATYVYLIDTTTWQRIPLVQGSEYLLDSTGRFELVVFSTDTSYNYVRKVYSFAVEK